MHSEPSRHGQAAFHGLTPPLILDLAEAALGMRCTNLCRPYNSYINRVYELADTAGRGLVIKFYRPGRWSRAGVQDEHDFLLELAAEELRLAQNALSEITGEFTADDLLGVIFSRFCIGK